MRMLPSVLRTLLVAALLHVIGGTVLAQTRYIVTNDDVGFPLPDGVSFFAENAQGLLTFQQQVNTGGYGIGGGYFGESRLAVANDGQENCIYASQAASGNIVGVIVNTQAVGGVAFGSSTDTGLSNGIGLLAAGGYLYASFTDPNTIGTFKIQTGCNLMFINDTTVIGLNGGGINAMAANGTILVASFTDGSIESFNISNGTPTSNGDEQISTVTRKTYGASFANQIEITQDGHYALFGDTSTAVAVEVSDLSSGKLSPTVAFGSPFGISSSNILLSPDETVLYAVNTQGDAVSAFFFDKSSGGLKYGCKSGPIKGQSGSWSYLSSAVLVSDSGNGGGVYVAEFGGTSGIALVRYSSTGVGKCTMQEDPASPFLDPKSTGLLSIGVAISQ
jgi:6-phosphogluconolactonase (cycloisomerase 2 family)